MKNLQILVVCYGNGCRSPMFQAILQQALNERGVEATVESAGLLEGQDGRPASENAQAVGMELGFDLSRHASRAAKDLNPEDFNHVYCMESKLAEQLEALGYSNVQPVDAAGDVPNPWQKGLEAYCETARVLQHAAIIIAGELHSIQSLAKVIVEDDASQAAIKEMGKASLAAFVAEAVLPG